MMKSDMATLAIYNEELVNTTTFAINDEVFNMAVERERKYKDVEEFESIFHANNCQLTEDKEFARMYDMTSFQYDEMESVHKFDKAFDMWLSRTPGTKK
jgi:predicted choloylglycine hydrolase